MVALPSGGRVQGSDPIQPATTGSTLTTALQVHQLPAVAAKRAYPVRLRAVVTYYDPGEQIFFVQDSSDGIFVDLNDQDDKGLPIRAGDEVEVIGVTAADFAPNVAETRIKVLGHTHFPVPKTGTFGSAEWGREDSRWIELEGIVQRVAKGRTDSLLTLAVGRYSYKAHVQAPPESLAHLVDAEVKVQGVCGALFNGKQQILGMQMFVPGAECIRVMRAASADPHATAPIPIADVLRFSQARDIRHRVRVQGTVTYPSASGPTWVRDATGGVVIQDHDGDALAVGDLVDVVGFPEIAGFGSGLRGAHVKRLQSGPPPGPVRITAENALKGDFDGQLVEIDGRLIDRLAQPTEQVLAVESGKVIFDAILPGTSATLPLQAGTRLRLTGICSVETEQLQEVIRPRRFRLLLRSAADVAILSRPPWLNADRLVPIAAGGALLVITGLAWVGLLRKRVRDQTVALRAQTVQLMIAHEKTRLALQKAREAESLDLDSSRILELIARDEPMDVVIDQIAEAIVSHNNGAVCAILLGPSHGPRACVVPALPADWLEALGRIDIRSVSCSSEFRAPQEFSNDPAWANFIDPQKAARFRTFYAAPIVMDDATAGVIATFFRNEWSAGDGRGAQLGSWCNIAALALERRRLHDQLSYRAQHDSLTGLPNRAMLEERLKAELELASRGGGLVGVLYIDLDGFKQINDTYGHDAGDLVLQEISKRMTRGTRRGDTVARIGGDEFVVLLPQLNRREDAEQIADKIAKMLRDPVYANHQRLSVSACFGIAVWPLDHDKPDLLLRFADERMYGEKKRRGYDAPADSPGRAMTSTGAIQSSEIPAR
jgi:diguanylate cyclase (GGDEF)-like protein